MEPVGVASSIDRAKNIENLICLCTFPMKSNDGTLYCFPLFSDLLLLFISK